MRVVTSDGMACENGRAGGASEEAKVEGEKSEQDEDETGCACDDRDEGANDAATTAAGADNADG